MVSRKQPEEQVQKEKIVVWPPKAEKQLERAYRHILKDSYQGAEKLREDILASTRILALNPERHPADKYRRDNDGNFRAYELHHYRIAYHISNDQITIIRMRHTAMNPLLY